MLIDTIARSQLKAMLMDKPEQEGEILVEGAQALAREVFRVAEWALITGAVFFFASKYKNEYAQAVAYLLLGFLIVYVEASLVRALLGKPEARRKLPPWIYILVVLVVLLVVLDVAYFLSNIVVSAAMG